VVRLDLGCVAPSLAGPKRPQDRIEIGDVAHKFSELFSAGAASNGFNQPHEQLAQRYRVGCGEGEQAVDAPGPKPGASRSVVEMVGNRPALESTHKLAPAATDCDIPQTADAGLRIGSGDVLIAAITSCTNTSNPSVLLAAVHVLKCPAARCAWVTRPRCAKAQR